jgi:DnaK suppressor protein
VDVQRYKQQLLELERDLLLRTRNGRDRQREPRDGAGDVGDAGLADEAAGEDFAEVDRDSTVLGQVREALGRIESGTFGRCVVDGRPIDPKRLDAEPWTAYCLDHQRLMETGRR